MLFRSVAWLLAGALLAKAASIDPNLSNGERIKRGLPPKSPERRYDPSRVKARDATTSQNPSTGYTNPGGPQVITVNNPSNNPTPRKRATYISQQFLFLGTDGYLHVGDISNALEFSHPGSNLVDGPLRTTGGSFVANKVSNTAGVYQFTTTTTQDNDAAGTETDIWNYDTTTSTLSVDRISDTGAPTKLYFGILEGGVLGGWTDSTQVNRPISLGLIAQADALAANPPRTSLPGTKVYLKWTSPKNGAFVYLSYTPGDNDAAGYTFVPGVSPATIFYRTATTAPDGSARAQYAFLYKGYQKNLAVSQPGTSTNSQVADADPSRDSYISFFKMQSQIWFTNPSGEGQVPGVQPGTVLAKFIRDNGKYDPICFTSNVDTPGYVSMAQTSTVIPDGSTFYAQCGTFTEILLQT